MYTRPCRCPCTPLSSRGHHHHHCHHHGHHHCIVIAITLPVCSNVHINSRSQHSEAPIFWMRQISRCCIWVGFVWLLHHWTNDSSGRKHQQWQIQSIKNTGPRVTVSQFGQWVLKDDQYVPTNSRSSDPICDGGERD